MELTTVRHKNKRTRSGSNNAEKIDVEVTVSPNKKSKKSIGQWTKIPDDTYFNAIKMENMILKAFPRLKETGMWTKYRINKRHKTKCYITLPKDHFEENVTKVIKSQIGFETCKVKVVKGINDNADLLLCIQGWPLCLGCRRVTYSQQDVGTFGKETFLLMFLLVGLEPLTYYTLGCQH